MKKMYWTAVMQFIYNKIVEQHVESKFSFPIGMKDFGLFRSARFQPYFHRDKIIGLTGGRQQAPVQPERDDMEESGSPFASCFVIAKAEDAEKQ